MICTQLLEDPVDEDRLVREHLHLVQQAVGETAARVPSYVRRDELVSAALEGLFQAVRRFDPARGVPFDRFAATRVRWAVLEELRRADWASRPARARCRQVRDLSDAMTVEMGRPPTRDELAAAAGMSDDQLRHVSADMHRATVVSYEAVMAGGQADMAVPAAEDDPEAEMLTRERNMSLADAVRRLPERLQRVIRGLYLENRSGVEIATELGVTGSRVCQLRNQALALLREWAVVADDGPRLAPRGGRRRRRRPDGRPRLRLETTR
jgi:RNA polymerase sigma factor for flagellar operon FliA